MKKIVGECPADCPVIAILEGREGSYDQANMRDGLSAEILAAVPHAKELVIAECPLGGPHKPRFNFGKLACSSEVIEDRNHTLTSSKAPITTSSEAALDQAAYDMSFGTRLV